MHACRRLYQQRPDVTLPVISLVGSPGRDVFQSFGSSGLFRPGFVPDQCSSHSQLKQYHSTHSYMSGWHGASTPIPIDPSCGHCGASAAAESRLRLRALPHHGYCHHRRSPASCHLTVHKPIADGRAQFPSVAFLPAIEFERLQSRMFSHEFNPDYLMNRIAKWRSVSKTMRN